MRCSTTILLCCIVGFSSIGQSRIYFSAGTSFNNIYFSNGYYVFGAGLQIRTTESQYSTKGLSDLWTTELLYETRLNKILSGVVGINLHRNGYSNSAFFDDPEIGGFSSDFDITNLGIPILFRANIANACIFDLGFLVTIPMTATLSETRNIGTTGEQSHSARITSSLTSNYIGGYGGYMCFTILINRYTLSASWQSGQLVVDNDFKDKWIIGNGSMFLTDMYPKFSYETIYLKLGMRLR